MTETKASRDVASSAHPSAVVYETRWGPGWIAFDETGLVETGLPGTPLPAQPVASAPRPVADLGARLVGYWQGGPLPEATEELIDRAATTRFRRRIYEVVSRIPRGETMTYAEVAAAAGRPGAARAVGTAMAENPFAPIIPCHRVVGSDGKLRGYGGGLDLKQELLVMEAADA